MHQEPVPRRWKPGRQRRERAVVGGMHGRTTSPLHRIAPVHGYAPDLTAKKGLSALSDCCPCAPHSWKRHEAHRWPCAKEEDMKPSGKRAALAVAVLVSFV